MAHTLELSLGNALVFNILSSLIAGYDLTSNRLQSSLNLDSLRDHPSVQRQPEPWRRSAAASSFLSLPLAGLNTKVSRGSMKLYQASLPDLSPSVTLVSLAPAKPGVEFSLDSVQAVQDKVRLPRECLRRHLAGEWVNVPVNGRMQTVRLQKTDLNRSMSAQDLSSLVKQFNIGEPLGSTVESIGRVSVNVPATYPLDAFMHKVIYPLAECMPVYQMLELAKNNKQVADTRDFVVIPRPKEDLSAHYAGEIPDPVRRTPLIVFSHGGFDSWQTNFGFDVRTIMDVRTIKGLLGPTAEVSPYNGGNSINVYFDAGRHGIKLDFSAARNDVAWFSGIVAEEEGKIVVPPHFISEPPDWFRPHKKFVSLDKFGGGLMPSSSGHIFRQGLASTLG